MAKIVKVLQLEPQIFEYLQHVVLTHSKSGIEPEEALGLHLLWERIKAVQTVEVPPPNDVASNPAG
jgi:hypothetical protein